MQIINVRANVAVANHAAATAWYAHLFGREADSRPMDGLAEWDITATSGLQVSQDAARAGTSTVTLVVNDLEACVADLRGRGIEVPDVTVGTGARFVQFTDPDGNTLVFAAALPKNP